MNPLTSNLKMALRLIQTSAHVRFAHKQTGSPVNIVCTGKPKSFIDFDCKVALITGGSDGIGLAIAHELLCENVKHVALVGVDNARGRDSITALNCNYGKGKAIFINCDVQSHVQVNDCYNKVLKEFGQIDIVVNAAGIFDGCNWDKELMTNLVGTIHSMLEAFKVMSKEENGCGGVILNLSGIHGVKPLFPAPTLAAGHHGIIGLSRSFGHETNCKISGIRVVTMCPGITDTNFVKNAEKRALTERWGKQLEILLSKVKRQKPNVCGLSAIHVLKFGNSGSVWVIDGSNLYSLNIPEWKEYRVLESQLI